MFRRSGRRNSSREPSPAPPSPPAAPPTPAYPDVWNKDIAKTVIYFVRSDWEWVMNEIALPEMTAVTSISDLPSEKQPRNDLALAAMTPTTPATRRRRNANKKIKGPSTLKLELINPETGLMDYAVHGTSSALEGMEDKDELVRTLQRCRCDHLHISPPSVLIGWDVSHEECLNVVGKELPSLKDDNKEPSSDLFAVLKEPMGSQGKGIYFVENAEEIHKTIDEHRQRALNEPGFLDTLIEAKGRIPSWVLQAEVSPSLLIKNKRKFHIRSYVVVREKLHHPDLVDIFIYNRHEVRIAGVPVPDDKTTRDAVSYITNGALSSTTERCLLHSLDELTVRDMQKKTEIFVAETFGKHLFPDILRRVNFSANQEGDSNNAIRKYALAGLDLMVTEENKVYLLEVNVSPGAPKQESVDETFKNHLKGFIHDLIDLVVGKPVPDFLNAQDILIREGLAE